ncbi:MAG: preQ(1) synthase [Deltaproteobacteria bacterium]|nr:preQ(1) synthase [Deltaproteobacteria bacterium]
MPRAGPLPRPAHPDEAKRSLKSEAFHAAGVQIVTLTAVEFTSVCPKTGQPDFGSVTIEYSPRKLCLESRSLKYYLWSYRQVGAYCETIAGRIADDIALAISPRTLVVRVSQNVRGGITITAAAERRGGRARRGAAK